ncbi:secondary thiamine-phosphate synthase enzyme YjbQ [Megalodesulfovibrio paquesii]
MHTMTLATAARQQMVSITDRVQQLLAEQGWQEGALVLFCPHTTAGLTVNEDADPTVTRDILTHLAAAVPHQGDYRHAEGNSDSHIKTLMTGPSLTLIVSGGRLQLGTWQGIFLCEYDGPRQRTLWAQWLGK